MKQKLREVWVAIYALPLSVKIPLLASHLVLLALPGVMFWKVGSGICLMGNAVVKLLHELNLTGENVPVALDEFMRGSAIASDGMVFWLLPLMVVAWIMMIPTVFMALTRPSEGNGGTVAIRSAS